MGINFVVDQGVTMLEKSKVPTIGLTIAEPTGNTVPGIWIKYRFGMGIAMVI